MKTTISKAKLPGLLVPNSLAYLPMAINFVQENALRIGFEEGEIKKIEIGVEEAVSNVIKHAFGPQEDAEFRIICERVPLGLKTIIKDKGLPFDPAAPPEFKPGDIKDDAPENGLGLYLMQQFMDEVSFHNLGREGKEIHLVKYLHHELVEVPPSGALCKNIETPEIKKTPFPPKSIPFTMCQARPSDAIEIAKCAYDAYKYSYIYEHIYYPDRLSQLIDSGKILSVVAVTRDKQKSIMAHIALSFDDPGEITAEMGMAFTKYEYQNQGCAKKLSILLLKEAVKKGLLGLWAKAITTHVYSQKFTLDVGFKESGILLGHHTDAWRWKHLAPQGQRVSDVLAYYAVPFKPHIKFQRQQEIYAPKHHHEMIEKIYSNLNRKPNYVDIPKIPTDLQHSLPVVKISTDTYDWQAKIEVKTYGGDIVRQIKTTVKKLCIDKLEVIYLYLNLTDPFTAVLTNDFEDLGFFFAGIMPGPVSGDKLVLQYLNNVLIDYDKIQLYSDFAKELLAYIKARDPLKNFMN